MFRLLSWKILTSSLLQTVKGGKKKKDPNPLLNLRSCFLWKKPAASQIKPPACAASSYMHNEYTHFPVHVMWIKAPFQRLDFQKNNRLFLAFTATCDTTRHSTEETAATERHPPPLPPPPAPPCHHHRHQPAVSTVPRTWAHIRSVALLLLLLQSHTWGETALTIAQQPLYTRPCADITGKVDGRNCKNKKKT